MKRLLVLTAAMLLATAAGCRRATPEPEVGPTEPPEMATEAPTEVAAVSGGTLIIGQGQEPDTLYIHGGSMLAARHVQHAIYDGPINGLDYDFQPVITTSLPKINDGTGDAVLEMVSVEAGEQYVDQESQNVVTATETVTDLPQLTVTWELVDGLTWEDGEPVKASDSVFSRDLACHPDTPTSKFLCDRTESYTALDDTRVQWKGLAGYSDQTYYTNIYTPLPEHKRGELTAKEILEDEAWTRKPLSYGPFKIDEWISKESIQMSRNEHYWRAGEGLPYLDGVTFRFVDDDTTLLTNVKTGDVDLATQDGLDIVQAEDIEAAEAAGELIGVFTVGTVWEHIDFNLQPVHDRPAILACADVRKAIAHGTDRQTMVDQIQKGRSTVLHTFVTPDHWAYPDESALNVYEYDPEQAKSLLEEAGWTDSDADGVREASEDISCEITLNVDGDKETKTIPAGTKLSVSILTTANNEMRAQTTQLFQQNMRDIGIEVNLDYQAANVVFQDGPDGPLFGRKFDLGEFAWLTGVQPSVSLYYCDQIPNDDNAWGGQNETGWCNPKYDSVGKRAEAELDRELSKPLYYEAQTLFTEALPVLPLFARVKVNAVSPRVHNFAPNASENSELYNIEELWLEP